MTGDLTSVFDFDHRHRQPEVTATGPVPPAIERWEPTPPQDQQLPTQEPGQRPARPLPYRPAVRAKVTGSTLTVELINEGTAPAHFALYSYAGELKLPEHRDVRSHHEEHMTLASDRFDLAVQGPNQFWYEAAGSVTGKAVGIQVEAQAALRGSLELKIINDGVDELTLTVRPLAFGGKPVEIRSPPKRSAWSTGRPSRVGMTSR